jgi:magnesium transporter
MTTPATPPLASSTADSQMVVNCVAYAANGTRRCDVALDDISDFLTEADGFVWIGLHEPDAALLEKLQEEFNLHDLAIEDAHKAHQRPKIEVYGDSLFVVVNTAQLVEGEIRFGETHIFLGPRYLVTVRHGASLSYAPARARCEREPDTVAVGPSYALYAVLDFIVDNFQPIVTAFQQTLRELEADIFKETFDRKIILRLYRLKRELTTLRLAVAPLQDILNQLVRLYPNLIREETRLYLRDVSDHAIRVNESTDTMREMLTAALSVNLALVTVAQGEVVKRLAGWAALLAAPTLVASWYGMNFEHMPELGGRFSYLVVIGITAAVVGGLFVALKRARWL